MLSWEVRFQLCWVLAKKQDRGNTYVNGWFGGPATDFAHGISHLEDMEYYGILCDQTAHETLTTL